MVNGRRKTIPITIEDSPAYATAFNYIRRDTSAVDAVIFINGKESTMDELKKLDPNTIESIDVKKDLNSNKKDKKAAGTIRVTTKKQ